MHHFGGVTTERAQKLKTPRCPGLSKGAHTFRKAKREGDAGEQGQLFGK